MGHCDSSTQFRGNGEHMRSSQGTTEASASQDFPWASAIEQVAPRAQSILGGILLAFLRIYKTFLSPFFGGACKYHPSCSNYAYEAVERHGARRGFVLGLKRLLRCHPFVRGGFDPVPCENESHPPQVSPNKLESF